MLVAKHDKIVIKPKELGERKFGNIIVSDLGRDNALIGEVVSIGPGRCSEYGKLIPVTVEVGDTVLLPKMGPIRFEYADEEYYLVADREILAVIKE